jgi:hypothetical protein
MGIKHLTLRRLEQGAHELHARELEGESAKTPLLVFAGVLLVIIPVFMVMLGAALAAYYLG